MTELILAVVFVAAGAASAVFGVYTVKRAEQGAGKSAPASLEERITSLAAGLSKAARAIDEIESETQARQQLVARLEADAVRHGQLLALDRDKVEAVVQMVGGEVRAESRRAARRQFWLGLLQSVFFFVAGIFVTLLVS